MRPRRSDGAVAFALLLALSALPRILRAQRGGSEGALFLLLPTGARAVGMGQAMVADRPGTEAVWWNPAGLAWMDKREVAIHHSQTIVGTGDAVTLAVPSSILGVLAGSINLTNFGESDATDPNQGTTGKILLRGLVYAASYATSVGDRFAAGVTYKVVQFRADCAGSCGTLGNLSASSTALDIGAQYDLGALVPATVAIAVRNVGPRLQVNDRDQADQLPRRVQLGVTGRVPAFARRVKDAELQLSADLIDDARIGTPSARVGGDLGWRGTIHVRGGYVFDDSESGGASVGVGVVAGGFVIDLARLFQGFSADAGQAPTYLSLRYLF